MPVKVQICCVDNKKLGGVIDGFYDEWYLLN